MYLVPEGSVNAALYLRLDESKQPDRTAHYAEDYLFEKNWPPEDSRDGYKPANGTKSDDVCDRLVEAFDDLHTAVAIPVGDETPFDLIAVTPSKRFVRCAIRTARTRDGRIFFNPDDNLNEDLFDQYLLYGYDQDQIYLIEPSFCDSSITLWVDKPEQIRKTTQLAEDYILERRWPHAAKDNVPKTILLDIAINAFRDLGVNVAYPTEIDTETDIVIESTEGRFLRVALEPGSISNGRIRLKPDSRDGIDYYLLICREVETCYLIGTHEFDVSISLRVEPPERSHVPIHYAEDYELSSRWPVDQS